MVFGTIFFEFITAVIFKQEAVYLYVLIIKTSILTIYMVSMRVVIYQIEKNEQLIYNLGILLDKLCLSGKQIGVLCNENDINNIDKGLWTFSTNAFVLIKEF